MAVSLPENVKGLVSAHEVHRILAEEVAPEVAAHVFDVLAEAPEPAAVPVSPTEKYDVQVADMLAAQLYALNAIDPDNKAGANAVYASDNTWLVERGEAAELTVYGHVSAALMQVLRRLTTSEERADQLRDALSDSQDTAYSLRQLRLEWVAEDREAAIEAHPVTKLVRALLDAQRGEEAYEAMQAQLVAAGAMWLCGECSSGNEAPRTECEMCMSPQNAQDDTSVVAA